MDIVYINDVDVDLAPDAVIAWTLQRVEIGDVTKNFVSYTNTIKAVNSPKNNVLFSNANLINSAGRFPYLISACKVVQNGIETITNAVCVLQESNIKGYNFVIYDSFVSLLATVEGKKLIDYPFEVQAWNVADIDTARLNTSGFLTAVCNFGRTAIYEGNFFLPVYFYKTLIQTILAQTGYTISGSILSSTDFTDLVCLPFKSFRYPDGLTANNVQISATAKTAFLTHSGDQYQDVNTDTVVYGINNTGTFDDLVFPVPIICIQGAQSILSDIVMSADVTGLFYNGGAEFKFQMCKNSISNVIAETVFVVVNGNYTVTASAVSILTGDKVFGIIRLFKTTVPGEDGTMTYDCTITSTVLTTVNRAAPLWGQLSQDVTQSDILKDFFVRFGIVYKLDNTNLILKTLKEIISDRASAIDWTGKAVNDISISYKTSYSKNNFFKYIDSVSEPTLGYGILKVINDNLSEAKDFFTSVFANALKWVGAGYDVFSVPVYDSTSVGISDNKKDCPFVLATLKDRTSEASITFNAVARTDYKLAYFFDSALLKDSSLQYFLNVYYKDLQDALFENKTITKKYFLNALDIAAYDPHKMIFDNGTYYLINKISNFQTGKVTEVELFKIQ